MEQMYKGIPFSPTATLTANISATDTIIPVSDVDAFPDAPNIATIGSIAGPNETIIYTGKTTTSLTGCTRGVEGTASDWAVDELIGRNFTAKDHADMVKNIEELESNKLDASYKVDVVNTADVSVGGKALDARQNNPSISGTLAQKISTNTQQINALNERNYITNGGGSYEYGMPTKPSDYNVDSFSVRRLRMSSAVNADSYGYWISIIGLRCHGESNCFELAFTSIGKLLYRRKNDSGDYWCDWEEIVTVTSLNNALAINNLQQV